MHTKLLAALMLGTVFFGCSAAPGNTDGGAGGGTAAGGGSAGGGSAATGWTLMPLLDETGRFHSDNDRVTSIYYASLTAGFVTTASANSSNDGAFYKTSAHKVESIIFAGHAFDNDDFLNIFKTSAGYVATMHRSDKIVASTDNGATFTAVSTTLPYGLSAGTAFVQGSDTKFTFVGGSGVVSESAAMTGPWTELWAPEGVPPFPNPVPPAGCQSAPRPNSNPYPTQNVYVGPSRSFVIYPSHEQNGEHQLCISTDGAHTFSKKVLTVDMTHAMPNGATGVTFINATTGFVYAGDFLGAGSAYIQRTTDTGATWTATTLPSQVNAATVDLQYIFFAPDGTHGFAVGWYQNPFKPLLLTTSDTGATWVEGTASASLTTVMDSKSASKLYAGFAMDAKHIWIGGERGVLLFNENGGNAP